MQRVKRSTPLTVKPSPHNPERQDQRSQDAARNLHSGSSQERSLMRPKKCFVSIASILFATTTLVILPSAEPAEKPTFVSFDFPLAIDTEATAISPSLVIVGRYTSADKVQHGFMLDDGKFTSIDVPGSSYTDITWVNARGTIVGNYQSTDGNRGFVLTKGVFTTVEYPGSPETFALYGISD